MGFLGITNSEFMEVLLHQTLEGSGHVFSEHLLHSGKADPTPVMRFRHFYAD